MFLGAAFLSLVSTVLFMLIFRPVAEGLGLVDKPGGRKRHGAEVPIIGGIAMSLAIGTAATFLPDADFLVPMMLAIYLLALVGTIDDKYDLPPSVRLIAQGVAALLVIYGSEMQVLSLGQAFFVTVNLGPLGSLFSLLFIVTLINAFNVIDGIDGLAGGLSAIGLLALAVVGFGCDVFGITIVIAAAVLGYLAFNLPLGINQSIRSFMGDAGSTLLGFSVASIGIWVTQDPVCSVAPTIGLWVVAVPVYDLFSAAIRRLSEGRSPFSSDHAHLHHALIMEGLSARLALVFLLGWAFLFAGIGVLGHFAGASDGFLLIAWFGGLILYYNAMRRPAYIVRSIQSLINQPSYRAARS